jgi:GAF domain-containing protein
MVPAHNSQAVQAEMIPEEKLVMLSRFLKALRGCQTAQEAMTLVLDHVHQTFEFEVAWLGVYDRIHHQLLTRGGYSPPHLRSIRTILPLTPGDVMEQVIIQQRPLIVADLQNEIRSGEWGAIARQLSLQSALIFPIKLQDTCFGLVVLASSQWGITPTIGDRAYLSIVLGNLAERIAHEEADQQRQQTKRFEQPFVALLTKLSKSNTIDDQLAEVVRETHRFIGPNRTRVYWFAPRGNFFWQRIPVSTPRLDHVNSNSEEEEVSLTEGQISVDEIRGLYQVLCNDQLVVLGESRGALKPVVSERLVQHLKSQALMLAPVCSEGDLLAFISVESGSPRIWKEAEKQFLMAAARLLGLTIPLASNKESNHQLQLDQHLTAGVIQGIYGDVDWHQTLTDCGRVLEERLSIQQFLVLLFNPDRNGYDLCFQHQAGHPRTVPLLWPCLDDVDWQMLERSQTPISIDSVHHNLKLTVWRSHLMELGAQSVLVCNVSPGNAPEGILIITDSASRHWTVTEQHLFSALGQQVGVILHQWQLQRRLDQQQRIYDSIQWGLHALHKRFHADQLEQTTVQQITQLLQAAAVLLISWDPGESMAYVTHAARHNNSVWVNEDYGIPVNTDAIINWAMQTQGILPLTARELPEETEAWFSAPADSRILITALRTAPEHCINSAIVVVSTSNNQWGDYHLSVLKLLTDQLAWSRRHLSLVSLLHRQRQELEHLNWYKHHRLEDSFQGLLRVAKEMVNRQQEEGDALTAEHQQLILSRLKAMVDSIDTVLTEEEWCLQNSHQTMPLISLINRLMEKLDPLLQARQLWSKVHNESSLILGGDMAKLEMIIYDVMAAACHRSPVRGRIDIWCRTVNQDWFELSITDDGQISPDLLDELKRGQPQDLLAPSLLDIPPGLRLSICQGLIRQLGGDITIAVLEDGRTHSRFLLPRATHLDSHKASPLPAFDTLAPGFDPGNPS